MIEPVPQTPSTHQQRDDIDLLELVHQSWMKTWLIINITAAVALIAAIYAFFTPPVHRVQAAIMPPLMKVIAGLNLGRNIPIFFSGAVVGSYVCFSPKRYCGRNQVVNS